MLATPEPSPPPEIEIRRYNCNQGGELSSVSVPLGSATVGGQQTVFRIAKRPNGQNPRRSALEDTTTTREQQPSKEPVYHPRRPHRMSRNGCPNCKRRRVKCDETKPQCRRCQTYGITCDYTAIQTQTQTRRIQIKGFASQFLENIPDLSSSPDSAAYSMSLFAAAEKIDELLQLKTPLLHGHTQIVTPPKMPNSLAALHHFTNFTLNTVGTESARNVMKGEMMRLAFNKPYLMHSIMAVATTHLCRILPDNSSYKLAEAYHWQQAISLHSKEIRHSTVGLHNMDALFSTCLLSSVRSFSAEEYKPSESWLFSREPPEQALSWLILQSGLRHLLHLTKLWLYQSIWWTTFMESHDDKGPFDDHRPGRVDLHPELADLCEIDDTTTKETNPYHWPLRMLSPLLNLERSANSFPKYTPFMGRLLPDYINLLLKKDPRALVILAWWLALMCSVKSWWIESRVRSECIAICMFLENSSDERILRLLEFPAEACGYLLRHLREQAVFEANLVWI